MRRVLPFVLVFILGAVAGWLVTGRPLARKPSEVVAGAAIMPPKDSGHPNVVVLRPIRVLYPDGTLDSREPLRDGWWRVEFVFEDGRALVVYAVAEANPRLKSP